MKREFLHNLKVGEAPLTKDVIDAIMQENGNDMEATKKAFADYESIKQQLTSANETIDGFKVLEVDGVKKAAEGWNAKAEQAERDAAAKIAEMKLNGLLSSAITGAQGKKQREKSQLTNGTPPWPRRRT